MDVARWLVPLAILGPFLVAAVAVAWVLAVRLRRINADIDERVRARTLRIYDTIHEIAERSQKTGSPTYRVADLLVEEKLARVGRASQA